MQQITNIEGFLKNVCVLYLLHQQTPLIKLQGANHCSSAKDQMCAISQTSLLKSQCENIKLVQPMGHLHFS